MAHENTRIRMMVDQVNPITNNVQLAAQPPEFLPMLTFDDEVTLHWGEETVRLVHYPTAHTDSDVVLYYENANVVFVGGLLEYSTYAGVYSPEGFIAAIDAVIAESDADTKIIPWQGPVVDIEGLREWRTIIETVSANVSRLIAEGATIDEIIAAHPSAEFDAKWGGGRTPERFARDMHYVLTEGARD
jgi:glyoxylase-like metal-dependent hydrolase (beta-lactamase superfamily II)